MRDREGRTGQRGRIRGRQIESDEEENCEEKYVQV